MTLFIVALFLANRDWVTKESNLDRFYYTIDLWLRTAGVGISKDNLNYTFGGILLWLISTIPYFYAEIIGVLYNYYYVSIILGESRDLLGLSTGLIVVPCFLTGCKAVWLCFSRREIYHVVTHAQELGSVTMPKSSWVLTTLYVVIICFNCTHRLFVPLRRGEWVLPEENMLLPGLENIHESPDYEISYIISGVAFFTFIPILCCFYGLYIGLAGHITAHYNKLCSDFENLLQRVTIDECQSIDYDELKKELTELIEQHSKILNVTNDVRMLFNSTLGFDFGLLTVGLGMLLIQIGNVGASLLIDYIGYYVITLIVYCMPGEYMRAAADLFPTSVWSSGWEVFKPNERRCVIMTLLLAQKRQILTAGTFVPVTYQTFVKILRMCFSIYAAFDAAKGGSVDIIVE